MLAFLSLIAAQFGTPTLPAGEYRGQCLYPEAVRERAAGDELVTCNEASVDSGGVTFGQRSWGMRMRFAGTFEGDRLTVESVTFRNGTSHHARGLCQLFYVDQEVSTIACTAVARGRSYAANFVVSRINPAD